LGGRAALLLTLTMLLPLLGDKHARFFANPPVGCWLRAWEVMGPQDAGACWMTGKHQHRQALCELLRRAACMLFQIPCTAR
jgi:hypothetical protein